MLYKIAKSLEISRRNNILEHGRPDRRLHLGHFVCQTKPRDFKKIGLSLRSSDDGSDVHNDIVNWRNRNSNSYYYINETFYTYIHMFSLSIKLVDHNH